MSHSEEVEKIILTALMAAVDEMPPEERFDVNVNSPIFGPGSSLDSLALVSVIVDVELEVADCFKMPISLTDDRAISRPSSPYVDVPSLTAYIMELIAEGNNK